MTRFRSFLFGRFGAECETHSVAGLEGGKVQELFCFLLLNRNHPHPRELLASLLWNDLSEAQSKQYLRKALWQLGTALHGAEPGGASDFLVVEPDWVQLVLGQDDWLDVAQFENAYRHVQDIPGRQLEPCLADELAAAASLYGGDLLEGWYQDWCIFERERLQRMYLIMLEKLMLFCESRGRYESGISYGVQALRYDRARERTHRGLIRLHYLSGNRTEALRQFHQCGQILKEELGVEPARQTVLLHARVLADDGLDEPEATPSAHRADANVPEATIKRLELLFHLLYQSQQRIQQELERVGVVLTSPDVHSQGY